MQSQFGIIHVGSYVGKASFGMGEVVLNLTYNQQKMGREAEIWSADSIEEARQLEGEYDLQPGTIHTFPVVGPSRLAYSPRMEAAIKTYSGNAQILHQHSIWTATSRVTERWRIYQSESTVVTPHGTLEPWALNKSTNKKRVSRFLFEDTNLHGASCLRATSQQEMASFRKFGLQNPVAVIPNGVSKKWLQSTGNEQAFREKHQLTPDDRIMLFVGRITPKKGLPMLIQALARNRSALGNWKLVIVGGDEFDHKKEVVSEIERLNLQPYVYFAGLQYGQAKRNAFAAADLLVLTTHSENFAIVVAEALGAGIPVLTTKGAPWKDLLQYDCGWWIDISVDTIAMSLEQVLAKSPASLAEMGRRGQGLARREYAWSHIAQRTLALYQWLVHGGQRPAFVCA